MRCLVRFRGFAVAALSVSLAASVLAACSSGPEAEAGSIATSGAEPLAITVSPTHVTIENRSGAPLLEGQVLIVPRGVAPPFTAALPRIEGSQKRDIALSDIRSRDGTPFRRGVTRARLVRVVATDVTGKKYEQEIPFE